MKAYARRHRRPAPTAARGYASVRRSQAPSTARGLNALLRAPAAQRVCTDCAEELQRSASAAARPGGDVSAAVASGTAAGGAPLPTGVRHFFEPRFGQDFGNVRLHTGEAAAASADALNARAYTFGHDIVFGANEYRPDAAEGRRLLAHELSHVVQQNAAPAARSVQRDDKGKGPGFPKAGVRVIGSEADDLVAILESCSGMDLERGKGGLLTLKAEGDAKKAKSPTARSAVKDIVSNTAGVIINADPKAEAVQVGAFSHEHPGVQTVDVGNIRKLAAASGENKGLSECDAVLHEATEAVAGRRLSQEGKLKGKELFKAAHGKGEETEKKIRKDLDLAERDAGAGDLVHFANEKADTMLLLDSMVFGSGKDKYTQISLVRFVLGPVREKGGEKVRSGDNQVVASHVVKGEVRFKTAEEAIKVFNTYAKDFGFQPIAVPEKKK